MEKRDRRDIGLEREGRGQVGASLGRWAGLEVALSTGQTGVGSRGALSLPALRSCDSPEALSVFLKHFRCLEGGRGSEEAALENSLNSQTLIRTRSPVLPLPVSPLSLFQLQIQLNSSSSELP